MPDLNLAEVGVKGQVTHKTSKTEKTTPDKELLDELAVKLQHMGREEAEKKDYLNLLSSNLNSLQEITISQKENIRTKNYSRLST